MDREGVGGVVLDVGADRPEPAIDEVVEEDAEEGRPDAAPAMLGQDARRDEATGDVGAVGDAAPDDLAARLGEEHQPVGPSSARSSSIVGDGLVRHHDAADVVPRLEVGVGRRGADGDLAVGDHGETVRHRAPVVPAPAG